MNRVTENHAKTELVSLIKSDARLSYQLISHINTLNKNDISINSLNEAIQLLNHDDLYRWLTLLLQTSVDPSPHTLTLLKRGLSRAFFLDIMANKSLLQADPQTMYLIGLLSVMDRLNGNSFAKIIPSLKLNPEIKQAILEHKGIYGLLLSLALAAEAGEQARIDDYAARCLVNPVEVSLAMINALVMAESTNL